MMMMNFLQIAMTAGTLAAAPAAPKAPAAPIALAAYAPGAVPAAPIAPAPIAIPAAIAEPADSAEILWNQARKLFADGEWTRASRVFRSISQRYPKSSYAGDALYYEAYSLLQIGDSQGMRRALELLDVQETKYASASTVKNREAHKLSLRIESALARMGDSDAAASIASSAARAASAIDRAVATAGVGAAAASRAAAAEARAMGVATRAGSRFSEGSTPPGCAREEDDDRVEALNALLQMNAEQAMPILKKVLARRDKCSELLRRKAIFLISQKRSDETADVLLAAARNDPDQEVKEQAVFWLSQVSGEKAEDLLLEILRDTKQPELQKNALFSLSQRRSEKAQKALRDFASRDDSPSGMREDAIFWIGQRRSEENAQFLRQLFLKSSSTEAREKILFSLSQMRGMGNGEFILEQVGNTKLPIDLRKNALFHASQGNDVTTAKLASIYDKSPESEMRDQVIFALSQRGNRDGAAVDKLLDIAKNEKDRELRKKAIFWLGQSRDPRAAKALADLIERGIPE